ncbi:MAG: fimbrillin family protein [Bacteroides sp.]|nr:fimbrillin family protein [Bacteroides sp.]
MDATTKAATVALEAKFYTNFTQTDDFCYATKSETDANLTSPSASFRLQSPYARITLSITRQGYACTAISELKLWIEQTDGTKFEFASTGTVNIQTGATSASGKVDELTLTDPASVTLPDDYSPCTIDLLLPSQTLPKDGKLCVSFKADTEPGLFQVSCSEFDASSTTAEVALKAGTQYKIPIQITRTGMGSDGPVDVGVKDIEVYFAPGNLRAVPDGKGGYTYSFAEEQGATLLTAEQLDEIQNNSILSISSSTSIDLSEYFYEETLGMVKDNSSNKVLYNKEKDPCAQVGDGKWRIPTKEEAELIVKLNPQRVCWDNSTQYYGLSCGGYQGTVPNKLFIPEIGYYADIDGSASIIGFNSHSFVYLCWGKTDNLFYEWVGYTEPLNGYTEISSYLATDGIYEYSQLMKFRYPIRCVRPKTEATP